MINLINRIRVFFAKMRKYKDEKTDILSNLGDKVEETGFCRAFETNCVWIDFGDRTKVLSLARLSFHNKRVRYNLSGKAIKLTIEVIKDKSEWWRK